MATPEERLLHARLNDVYMAVDSAQRYSREFRKNLFNGQYRKIFLNGKDKFDADLRYLSGVFGNSYHQVQDAIVLARANNIMSEIIDNIHNLNENVAESYGNVINASEDRALGHNALEYRALEHRAQISARVDETINILKKLQESIRELSGALEERVPANLLARMAARPPANNRNGGSRKRTHRKHRKRTHRKHRK